MSAPLNTLGAAWRDFSRRRSPRLLGALIAATLTVRIALGDWSWHDLAAVGAMVAIYPFGEWAIHVYLLHLRPFRLRGKDVELPTSRSHRQHHERPTHMGLILLGPVEVALLGGLAVPLVLAAGAVLVWPLAGTLAVEPFVTAALTGYVLIALYEWTHFLIHTAYRPRSRPYRRVWQTHRLHHFKNEHYWHGITNTLADRVFGTLPDHRDVERSPTARTLTSR
jgi:Fatty acid hydroxylase